MLERLQRVLRHSWRNSAFTRRTMTPAITARLHAQVTNSEKLHSGEIRIYIEAGLPPSYLWRKAPLKTIIRARALSIFGKLRVWDTAHNNGVLIYLLLAEHAIEIVADRGISAHVSPHAWQAMIKTMRETFQRGEFEEGLNQALRSVTEVLCQHFPLREGESNPNELPDAPMLR